MGSKENLGTTGQRFGAPEIDMKLSSFHNLGNKDTKMMYDLLDIMIEIEMLMGKPKYIMLLSNFTSSSGVMHIISKLPTGIQEKWMTRVSGYKTRHNVPYPRSLTSWIS